MEFCKNQSESGQNALKTRMGSMAENSTEFSVLRCRKDFAASEKQVIFETKTGFTMIVLEKQISLTELTTIAGELYGDMVKAVADVANSKLAIDAELHSDLERFLLENGSDQENLWGFNIYPGMKGEDFIEFDSLINIRPRQNNRSRYVESGEIRDMITRIVDKFIGR